MKITIESTDKIVKLVPAYGQEGIDCRVWEGQTESGVKVHCFIPRIAAKDDQDLSQFEKELQEKRRDPGYPVTVDPVNYLYCWHRPGPVIRGEIRQCRHCGVAVQECVCFQWRQAAARDCPACEGSGWVGILRSKAAGLLQMVGL